jgi:Peptidase A4 family
VRSARTKFSVGLVTVGLVTVGLAAMSPVSAVAAPKSFTHENHAPLLRHGHAGVQKSLNWSGYIKSGGTGAFKKSTASWTVPTLKTNHNGFSSTWVGIDGATDGFLIQTGTEADVINGRTHFDAWWEVITPTNEAPEVVFTAITVHAGDAITATVAKGTGGKWTMTLNDITAGKTGTHTAAFSGPGKSAEWIQEDPAVGSTISAAPDWQKVSFKNITANGVNPKLVFSQSVDIYDSHNTQEDNTAAPTGGNAFTVTWLATGTPTPI